MALSRRFSATTRILSGTVLLASTLSLPAHAATSQAPHAALTASQPLTFWWGSPPMTRNFNIFTPQPLELTKALIYEPLYIVSYVGNKTIPWLATAYAWSKDDKTLTFTIRSGVKWSDGQPFSADDVYYTLNLKNGSQDQVGLWGAGGLATSVTEAGNTVSIHFKRADVSTFADIVNNLYIVPQHIWSKVKNPLTWANPNPVGTGPFTEVKDVMVQSYDIGKNPYSWQKIDVDAVRAVATNSNDAGYQDMASGKIDWASAFVPAADTLCEQKNPNCHHFFSTKGTPVMLYLNNARYPYSLPAFRKAVSMAINRQALFNNAEYGYEPPSTITGLNGQWSNWVNPSVSNASASFDVTAAQAALKSAGFTLKNGSLIDPKGAPVTFDMNVVTGWSDWVAMDQIVSQNLKALGITATPKPLQYGDYFTRESTGNFDAAISWSCGGATPYSFFNSEAGTDKYEPIGTSTTTVSGNCNFERYQNPQLNSLLYSFRVTTDASQQHALVNKMQQIWARDVPAIPLVIGAIWYEYNTTHYTGFPTLANPYVNGNETSNDKLVVLTHLHPTGR